MLSVRRCSVMEQFCLTSDPIHCLTRLLSLHKINQAFAFSMTVPVCSSPAAPTSVTLLQFQHPALVSGNLLQS